jgi:RNA-directed DNA polymerase
VTWQAYGENLDTKLKALHDWIHKGSYRARPAKRTYIPKADGSKRPLSVWWRGQHDALDALHVGILRRRVNWVLDADIRGFLDPVSYCPLIHVNSSLKFA